ncbi:putative sialic acid transporter [Salmonella enterica subsp. enterica]|uniref:Putative sialic acid transporter n=1 Tax=Salmonella enterica I TaxID=59201 RepID=A0A3S4I5J0_SALET|nr:putative sialic acid transporter [Salmonella enterica subsp. enterica]
MVGVLLFLSGLLPVSFSNLHPGQGLLNLKSGKKLNSVVPESIHKVPGQFFSLSMKGLFNRAQFPLTLCVFIVLFSIFGANWPIFGLLPTYLTGEGFDTGVVSNLMTAAAFGTVLGKYRLGSVRR